MDFAITTDGICGAMTWDKAATIFNNIFLSLTITRGEFFAAPDFGLRNRGRMKNTERNALLVRDDCRQALQWLIDTGRATSIDVGVERDRIQDPNRLKVLVTAVQANGQAVTFETFKAVV
jgi:phage gp46-like protein